MTTPDDNPLAASIVAAGEPELPLADDRQLADEPRNDLGNARRLMARFGRNLIWVQGVGWFVWDGRRWAFTPGHRDGPGPEAMKIAHMVSEAIHDEAETLRAEAPPLPDEADDSPKAERQRSAREAALKRAQAHHKFAVASGNAARCAAMLQTAAPYLWRTVDDLNRDPLALTCLNGTLHISKDGAVLRDHNRADLITMLAPVEYRSDADCPKFHAFFSRVQPKPEQRAFILAWTGYGITGLTGEQAMAFFIGKEGANGKSTFLQVVADILGDYAVNVPIETFLHNDRKRGSDASPDLARLPHRHFAKSSEPEAGARFSESVVKSITSGERLTVRPLYGTPFEFEPIFKLTVSANTRPIIKGSDGGIWRRIHVVPWNVTIPKNERDPTLHRTLVRDEAAGILRLLVDRAVAYCEAGHLPASAAVDAETEMYRHDSDPLGEWLDACCVVSASGPWTSAAVLYQHYCRWCRASAITPVNDNLFGRLLRDKGVPKRVPKTTEYQVEIVVEDIGESSEKSSDGSSEGPGGPEPPPY